MRYVLRWGKVAKYYSSYVELVLGADVITEGEISLAGKRRSPNVTQEGRLVDNAEGS